MSTADLSLGALARNIPGATRIFHEYQFDFCCGGKQTLREAAKARGVDPEAVVEQLEALQAQPGNSPNWSNTGTDELIDHILVRYHQRHREQLTELLRLARRVEQVHGDRPECPNGLADHLAAMQQELEGHMLKEEQILFPAMRRGMLPTQPISVMRFEHDQHGEALEKLSQLTNGITLPRGACNTWRALYLGLATMRDDLIEHIHLENNILFEGLTHSKTNH